jgi:hypothetical protein
MFPQNQIRLQLCQMALKEKVLSPTVTFKTGRRHLSLREKMRGSDSFAVKGSSRQHRALVRQH